MGDGGGYAAIVHWREFLGLGGVRGGRCFEVELDQSDETL